MQIHHFHEISAVDPAQWFFFVGGVFLCFARVLKKDGLILEARTNHRGQFGISYYLYILLL